MVDVLVSFVLLYCVCCSRVSSCCALFFSLPFLCSSRGRCWCTAPGLHRSHFGSRYQSGRCALRSPFAEPRAFNPSSRHLYFLLLFRFFFSQHPSFAFCWTLPTQNDFDIFLYYIIGRNFLLVWFVFSREYNSSCTHGENSSCTHGYNSSCTHI